MMGIPDRTTPLLYRSRYAGVTSKGQGGGRLGGDVVAQTLPAETGLDSFRGGADSRPMEFLVGTAWLAARIQVTRSDNVIGDV